MKDIPKRFKKFMKDFPSVAKGYDEMGRAVYKAGPLDKKTCALIKLAVSTGSRQEGAVHSHTRKALEAGATKKEIRHTVVLALPTIGFPSMMAAMSWVDDILDKK